MRLMPYLMTICATSLTTGCSQTPLIDLEPPVEFCDVEEPRRFTQEELDWRAEHAPWNLRLDFKTNSTWDRECLNADQGETGAGLGPGA